MTSEKIDYENEDKREAFKCILDEAKQKTGFDCDCRRLFIRVFPSKDGGCEVYVTKGTDDKDRQQQKKNANVKKEYCVFRLDSLDRVCRACRCVMQTGYIGESILYFEQKHNKGGVYYLVLQEESRAFSQQKKRWMPDKCEVVREFGTRVVSFGALNYIKEHCEEICPDNAVEKMSLLV